MEKFKKYMDILDKGLHAIGIAFLVVTIVMVAFAVIGFIGIEGVSIGEIDTILELGVLKLEVAENLVADSEKANDYLAVSSLLAACQFFIAWVLVKILRKLVSPMKEGNIFDTSVPKTIKELSFYVLIGGLFTEIINIVGSIMIVSSYDISALFNADGVINHSYSFEMNGNFVVYAAIIYLLSYVFKYGSELQTQVDETL